jgi:ligand-binding sensor domain-containing protein
MEAFEMAFGTRLAALGCLALCFGGSLAEAAPGPDPASGWQLSQWQRHVWQIEDGLPNNYVTAIASNSERYLLVGTQSGIAMFDGTRFTHFRPTGDLWIYSLLRASDGVLWVGTYQQGLYRVKDGHAEHWGAAKGFTDNIVYSLIEDKNHRIWLTSSAGLYLIEHDRIRRIVKGGSTHGYSWEPVTVDDSGSIWFATADGVFRYASGTARLMQLKRMQGAPVTMYFWSANRQLYLGTVSGLYTLKCAGNRCECRAVPGVKGPVVGIRGVTDGSLWVATWGRGLYRLSGQRVEQFSVQDGLADNFVRIIAEDAEHNVWVGTRGGGLTRFRTTVLKPIGIPEGLGGNCASAVVEDGHDGAWLGTWRSGLFHWRNGHVEAQQLPQPSLRVLITSLALDNAHRLWIGTMKGNFWVLSHFGAKAQPAPLPVPGASTSHLLFDKKGELWLAQEEKGIFLFPCGDPRTCNPVHLLPGQTVTALYKDSKGAVWIGTEHGLWRANMNRGHKLEEIDSSVRHVTAIHEDSKGRMWVACAGGQILVYSGASSQPFRYANLPSREVYNILEDDQGGMWFYTSQGLARGSIRDIDRSLTSPQAIVHLSAYGVADGMRTIECRCAKQPQSWKMSDGTIWVPTAKGFIQIDESRNRHLPPPKPVVQEILLDGREVTADGGVRIRPGRHELAVHFTALRLGGAEGVHFRYRMAGLEPNWVWAGSDRVARYGQLPPGRFQFMVSAQDAGGTWSKPAFIDVEQTPHIYQTGWFQAVLFGLILGLLILAYRVRLRMVHTRYSAVIGERNRIAREFHDTLLAGLAAVSWQIDTGLALCRGQEAEPNLRTACGMLRYCRDEARRAVGDLRDEPDAEPPLAMAIEKAVRRMTEGTGVQASFDADKDSREIRQEVTLDLVRVCQESISNALRHAHASKITVRLHCDGGQVRLSIKDDGSGSDPDRLKTPPAGHFGILGMRERVRHLGGSLLITSNAAGTLVEAIVPVSRE